MKKRFIFSILIAIIIVSVIFLDNFGENEEKKFVKPKIALKNSLYSVRLKYKDVIPEYNIEKVNEKNKEKFDENLREKLFELLNMPFDPVPGSEIYNFEIESLDKESYIQSHVTLLTSNSSTTYAYLLVPKNIKKAPAILAMHQHGDFYDLGKEEVVGNKGNPNLFFGKELAERGYIVLAADAALFGQRKDIGSNPKSLEISESQHLLSLGHPPLGVIVQEDLVSLEFLNALDIVDKENIGCIGHSFGGTRCMYLGALDERVKVTVLSNSVAEINQPADLAITSTWLSILPNIAKYAETGSILGLIAPRPMLIIYSEKDPIFPSNQAETQINSVNELYTKLNKKDNFKSIFIPNESHSFPKKYHEEAYQFLDKNLKN